MKRLVFITLLLSLSLGLQAQEQVGDSSPMVLKRGSLFLNGEKLSSSEAIIAAIGQDVYEESWKPAAAKRKTGIVLISVGAGVAAWGLAGYITALVSPWPDEEADPDRWNKFNTAYSVTKLMTAGGLICLGAGIHLFCVGNGQLKGIRDNYNQSVTLSLAPCGLGLTYRF